MCVCVCVCVCVYTHFSVSLHPMCAPVFTQFLYHEQDMIQEFNCLELRIFLSPRLVAILRLKSSVLPHYSPIARQKN